MWLAVFNVGFDPETYKQKEQRDIFSCMYHQCVFNFIISGGMNKIEIVR